MDIKPLLGDLNNIQSHQIIFILCQNMRELWEKHVFFEHKISGSLVTNHKSPE